MNPDPSTVAALVSERMGLHYPPDRADDLARGLEKAAADLGFATMHNFVAHLMSDQFGQREVQAIAAHLTIGETHFFRSPELFTMLESWLLPELIAAQQTNGRRLRIWSAGCASGQEPYSLAILLTKLLPKPEAWDLNILATDINPDSFALAKAGEYTQWSFRGTPAWVINNHFTKLSDGRFRLDAAIRDMVTFRYLNLADDLYPAPAIGMCDFDLILCRNVLMYFSPTVVKQVGDRLHKSLREFGYLIVTPSEASRDVQCSMTSMMSGGEILYKKTPVVDEPATPPRPSRETSRAPQAPARRPHAAAPKDQPVTPPAEQYRSRETTPPSANEQAWPTVDRRRSDRPFSDYAKRKAAEESQAQTKHGSRAQKPAVKIDPYETAKEARLLADKGDRKKALACVDDALEVDKLNPSLYYLKASILQEMGRYDEAERALQSILFLDGDFALARVMLGAIARGQSRWTEASRHFGAALAQLAKMPPDLVLPETDGLTAGQMAEAVASLMGSECVS
jgi:chemotaxis protein methyltransferase CheR